MDRAGATTIVAILDQKSACIDTTISTVKKPAPHQVGDRGFSRDDTSVDQRDPYRT
jgi:hypothetical protein